MAGLAGLCGRTAHQGGGPPCWSTAAPAATLGSVPRHACDFQALSAHQMANSMWSLVAASDCASGLVKMQVLVLPIPSRHKLLCRPCYSGQQLTLSTGLRQAPSSSGGWQ